MPEVFTPIHTMTLVRGDRRHIPKCRNGFLEATSTPQLPFIRRDIGGSGTCTKRSFDFHKVLTSQL